MSFYNKYAPIERAVRVIGMFVIIIVMAINTQGSVTCGVFIGRSIYW